MGMMDYYDGPLHQHRTCKRCEAIFFQEEDNPDDIYLCPVCAPITECDECGAVIYGYDRIGDPQYSELFRCKRCEHLVRRYKK